jgi:hypothetical protein
MDFLRDVDEKQMKKLSANDTTPFITNTPARTLLQRESSKRKHEDDDDSGTNNNTDDDDDASPLKTVLRIDSGVSTDNDGGGRAFNSFSSAAAMASGVVDDDIEQNGAIPSREASMELPEDMSGMFIVDTPQVHRLIESRRPPPLRFGDALVHDDAMQVRTRAPGFSSRASRLVVLLGRLFFARDSLGFNEPCCLGVVNVSTTAPTTRRGCVNYSGVDSVCKHTHSIPTLTHNIHTHFSLPPRLALAWSTWTCY